MMVSGADTARFQSSRPHLLGIARQIVGTTEAEDVVQDTWLRWQRCDRSGIHDPAAFLATATRRLAVNVTASARVRRETYGDTLISESPDVAPGPFATAERRDTVRRALHEILERLTPTECAAYLLREAFGEPYRRISETLSLNEANVRQIVRRTRKHLAGDPRRAADPVQVGRLFDAFFEASQSGDLPALERALNADIVRAARCGRPAAA